ncbi:heterochromatin protein 1-like [Armigeres subalbatus]|uniref:heterochromatin protein 1-like n=1 Tax=Armigeres subalbatus TaxID=124917 RepID=UPI002ED04B1B
MATGEQYVVEKVVDKRIRRGVVQYLIKWTGCDDSQNTWEPEGNLKCDALLKQFLEEKADAKLKKRGRASKALPSDNDAVDAKEEGPKKRDRSSKSLPSEGEQANAKGDGSRKRGRSSKSLPLDDGPKETKDANANEGPAEKVTIDVEKSSATIASEKMSKQPDDSPKEQLKESLNNQEEVKVEKQKDVKKRQPKRPKLNQQHSEPAPGPSRVSEELNGFERRYTVDSLVGITEEGGKLCFLVKFQENPEMEMIPSAEVRKFVPEMMIEFYENRIIWNQKSGAKRPRN